MVDLNQQLISSCFCHQYLGNCCIGLNCKGQNNHRTLYTFQIGMVGHLHHILHSECATIAGEILGISCSKPEQTENDLMALHSVEIVT